MKKIVVIYPNTIESKKKRFIKQFLVAVFILSFAFSINGCDDGSSTSVSKETKRADQYFTINLDSKIVEVQVAISRLEIERGLMFRQSLAEMQGMLFIHKQPGQMRYWMCNVSIPLSIGFFDSNGILKETYPMYPYEESPVISANTSIQFVLEVNQGWFTRNSVKPGARISLDEIKYLLEKRGFSPETFLHHNE